MAVLVILMINNDGLIGKAPKYLMEKFREVNQSSEPEAMLDHHNMRLLMYWMERWKMDPPLLEKIRKHVAECDQAEIDLGMS